MKDCEECKKGANEHCPICKGKGIVNGDETLRGKMYYYLAWEQEHFDDPTAGPKQINLLVDDIFKIFEEKIDEQIRVLQGFKEISSSDKIKEYNIAIKYFRGFKRLYLMKEKVNDS